MERVDVAIVGAGQAVGQLLPRDAELDRAATRYGSSVPWPEAFDALGFPIHRDGQSAVVARGIGARLEHITS